MDQFIVTLSSDDDQETIETHNGYVGNVNGISAVGDTSSTNDLINFSHDERMDVDKEEEKTYEMLVIERLLSDEKIRLSLTEMRNRDAAQFKEFLISVYQRSDPIKAKQKIVDEMEHNIKCTIDEIDLIEKELKWLKTKIEHLGDPSKLFQTVELEATWDEASQCIIDNSAVQRVVSVDEIRARQVGFRLQHHGEVVIPELVVGSTVLCPTQVDTFDTVYNEAEVAEIKGEELILKIGSKDSGIQKFLVTKKEIIVKTVQNVLLKVGQRVIAPARDDPEQDGVECPLVAGIIAERPLKAKNDMRYLVFFDNLKTAYCGIEELYVHYNSLSHDVIKAFKNMPDRKLYGIFLDKYFKSYPQIVMLRPQIGHKLKMLNEKGKYINIKVRGIDDSTIKIRYRTKDKKKNYEWIFRGSHRLKPIADSMFTDKLISKAKKQRVSKTARRSAAPRRNWLTRVERRIEMDDVPEVDERLLTQIEREAEKDVEEEAEEEDEFLIAPEFYEDNDEYAADLYEEESSPKYSERNLRNIQIEFNPDDKQYEYIAEIPEYQVHRCSPKCLPFDDDGYDEKRDLPGTTLFVIPTLHKFHRLLSVSQRNKFIHYVTPCGKMLRDIEEVDWYLDRTNSQLTIDMFSFDTKLQLVGEKDGRLEKYCKYLEQDFSNEVEPQPISVMNVYQDQGPDMPENFIYIGNRVLNAEMYGEQIAISTDTGYFCDDFRMCCDCTDNCARPDKCACQQLTQQGLASMADNYFANTSKNPYGYKHRRLFDQIASGVYECNDSCPCTKKCPNRLAQLGVRLRLQLYKYPKKGWGVRTLQDIPEGTFVCLYVAEVITPSQGDTGDDTYYAQMDIIETHESYKGLDYESEAECVTDEESETETDESDGDFGQKYGSRKKKEKKRRKRAKEKEIPNRYRLYKEDGPYVLDGRVKGNIGRFLNHSCDPNAYCQNVFIETHDLRFTHMALFTSKFVKAYEELTWNYAYVVGSVPGKNIPCRCGARNCRKRLL
ncbi:Histone-lysine N-methyltransferase eggless [Halotydeus destructor]|nr:Histone-lysine N-methyltransferase eggless [Halotydeus destructor]